jgi:hypothetical protein
MASKTGNTPVLPVVLVPYQCKGVGERTIRCNMHQSGKHSRLLISGANTKLFNFNNNFVNVSEKQCASTMSR